MPESLICDLPLGAFLAKPPLFYVIRLVIAALAFGAAMNVEKVIARAIGLGWLLLAGGGMVLVGIKEETIGDILLGLVALGAAGYAWWYTRS